jgi:type IX secretion system PorP/SprF family membrane protein
MKKILLLGFLVMASLALRAQQRPQFSQYMINPYVLNPAVGGVEKYVDIRAGYRNQWVGFTDAHPVTTYLSVHGPIGQAKCFNTRTKHRTNGFHGVGGYVMHDKTGPISRIHGYVSYAYHLQMAKKTFISLGLSGGVQQFRLDANQLDIRNPDQSSVNYQGADYAVLSNRYQRTLPDISAGAWFYSSDFFAGASVGQIAGSPLELDFNGVSKENQGKLVHHYFLISGYRFRVDRDLSVIPSIAAKGVGNAPLSLDLNCKVRYLDSYWAGVSYRKGAAVAVMAGIVINKMFDVSYSYDAQTTDIRKYAYGSHEIVVGYRLPIKPNLICPSHFW